MKQINVKAGLPFLFVLGYVLVYYRYSQSAIFENDFAIGTDFSQHMLWLFTFGEHNFQTGDVLVEFSALIQPWGFYILNRFLVVFFDPLTISRFFPVVLLFITCWFTYLLLQKRFGWAIAFAGVFFMSHIPFGEMVGSFARAYAYPLLLGFLYFWVEKKQHGVALLLILSALFYPVVWLFATGIITLYYARQLFLTQPGHWVLNRQTLLIPIVLVLCGGILLLKSWQIGSSVLAGDLFDRAALISMPEFQAGGRVYLNFHENLKFPLKFPWNWYLDFPYAKMLVYLSMGLLIWGLIKKPKHRYFDWTLLSLALTGTALYYLSILLLPKLFIPSRYIYYSFLPFLYLLILRALAWLKPWWQKPIPGLLLIAVVIYSIFHDYSSKNHGLGFYEGNQLLYEKIRAIHEPVLFAGPPSICNHIPTFCRQSVLFSEEAAHAIYFKDYYNIITPRINDFVEAYTANNIEEVKAFIQRYDLDYLIIDHEFFSSGNMRVYEPHRSRLKEQTRGKNKEDYALYNLPDSLLIKSGGRYDLLDCHKLW